MSSRSKIKSVLNIFTKQGLGGRVETRRWFTLYQGNQFLDKVWNLLLLAVVFSMLTEGTDPWAAATIHKATFDEDGDTIDKDFSFKRTVLGILMSPFNRNMLRSHQIIFARVRAHHGVFISRHFQPGYALRFSLFWADERDSAFFLRTVVPQSCALCICRFRCLRAMVVWRVP